MEPRQINRLVLAAGSSCSSSAKQNGYRNSNHHPAENAKRAALHKRYIGDFSRFIRRNGGCVRRRVRDEKPNEAESQGKDWPGNQSTDSKCLPRNLDWGGSLGLGCRANFANYPAQ